MGSDKDKSKNEKNEKTVDELLDIDLDAKQLYGDHLWYGNRLVRWFYSPMWKLFSKDYQQAIFVNLPKEKRVKLIKERAKTLMATGYYSKLPTIADLVGREKEVNIFLSSVYSHVLKHPEVVQLSQPPPKVFIVKGEPGSGKSFLIKAVMREAFDRAIEEGFILDLKPLEGAAINSPFMGMYSGAISGAFADAQKKPTFLFIDEAQQIVQKGSNLQGDSASKEYQQAESAILTALDNIMSTPVRTIVVMGSNTVESIREDIRRRAFLIDLDSPGLNHEAMQEIVKRKLSKMKLDMDAEKVLYVLEQELRGLGEARMVPHDLTRAFDEVVTESERPVMEKFLNRTSEKVERVPITYDSFKAVAPKVRAYKEQLLTQAAQESEQTVPPKERYTDVGGLKGVKDEIIKEVTLSLNPSLGGEKWVPPRGYLFHGPAGTGKTLLTKAIAGENKCPVYVVNAASLMSGLVGESEKSMRQVFARARSHAPSIVFMDELDSIGRARGSSIGGNAPVAESMLTTLLTQLEGFNPKGRVVFIGATNRKDILDPALLERLDKQFEFTYPKTTDEKLDVLKTQWQEFSNGSDVTAEQILKLFLAKSFSPRVSADVVKEAARMAQMESIACKQIFDAMSEEDVTNMDEQKIKSLKAIFAEEFERILRRNLVPDVEGLIPETNLLEVYQKVAQSNPITMEHLKAAFQKKAETEAMRDARRFSEMHRGKISEVGKGYGLSVDTTETQGIFLTIECKMFKAERRHRGVVNCFGNLGVGAKEAAWMARDFVRGFNPRVMDYDFDLHVISLGEGGENVAVSGPSAGMAFLFVILSRWLNEPFNNDVCMTGKIDFSGIVGIVGGVQPKSGAGKLDAARENHFKYCLIPDEALQDLKKDWKDYVDASLEVGTEIIGGKTWLDYARLVFPQIADIEARLKENA